MKHCYVVAKENANKQNSKMVNKSKVEAVNLL